MQPWSGELPYYSICRISKPTAAAAAASLADRLCCLQRREQQLQEALLEDEEYEQSGSDRGGRSRAEQRSKVEEAASRGARVAALPAALRNQHPLEVCTRQQRAQCPYQNSVVFNLSCLPKRPCCLPFACCRLVLRQWRRARQQRW